MPETTYKLSMADKRKMHVHVFHVVLQRGVLGTACKLSMADVKEEEEG